jgi:TonB family protein
MAPILKELEATVAATSASAPAIPLSKPSNETPTRPQPVALEIPVTVNGARTVDGSDKREPFSETTQTVLVFPLGAVIRTVTPLVPGQLVFLTNEKTKKEVVCQVVKSKSSGNASGNASGYVELQFTEPSAGFWGLQIPGASAVPSAPRAVAPAASATQKATAPAAPVASKPVAPKPIAPVATMTPAKPVVTPPPPAAMRTEPAASHSVPAVPAIPVPPIAVAPPPAIAPVPEIVSVPVLVQSLPPADAAPQVHVLSDPLIAAPQPAATVVPPAPVAPAPVTPVLPIRDYSKQIDALFAVPQAPVSPAVIQPTPEPTSAAPSSEDLKLQAARLQAQLSSLLFTETPSAAPVTPKPDIPVAEVTKKILEIAQEEPRPVVKSEPKPALPVRKSAPLPLAAEEEVRIPSWLAPLSQNSEALAAESADSNEATVDDTVSVNSEESYDALVDDAPGRPQTAVFGGTLLGEASAQAGEVSSTGSKKGLYLGLAAAVVLLLGGAWYYRQNFAGSRTLAATQSVNTTSSALPPHAPDLPASSAGTTSASNGVNSSPGVSSPPSKNTPSAPIPAVSAPQPRNARPAPKNEEPDDPPKKPSLGDVRLATPVVNRATDSQQEGDAAPSIETNSAPSGVDPLTAASHRAQPAVPLPVGGDVKPAQLLKSVPPEYPALAKEQHVYGSVQIDALIDAAGNVQSVQVLSGPPLLHHAALDSVKQWKYSPALLDGQPTPMHLTVTVQFRHQ